MKEGREGGERGWGEEEEETEGEEEAYWSEVDWAREKRVDDIGMMK